jgi:hypothetical protein
VHRKQEEEEEEEEATKHTKLSTQQKRERDNINRHAFHGDIPLGEGEREREMR